MNTKQISKFTEKIKVHVRSIESLVDNISKELKEDLTYKIFRRYENKFEFEKYISHNEYEILCQEKGKYLLWYDWVEKKIIINGIEITDYEKIPVGDKSVNFSPENILLKTLIILLSNLIPEKKYSYTEILRYFGAGTSIEVIKGRVKYLRRILGGKGINPYKSITFQTLKAGSKRILFKGFSFCIILPA